MSSLFLLHLAVTWTLVGLIWVVQILVYPQFLRVPATEFTEYHRSHCFRIGFIVAPLLFTEVATASWLLYQGASTSFAVSAALIPLIWLSTVVLQAPAHTRLMGGFDEPVIHHLIRTNWFRTLAWTARGVLVSLTLP